jgi:hypothetical protein
MFTDIDETYCNMTGETISRRLDHRWTFIQANTQGAWPECSRERFEGAAAGTSKIDDI